MKKTIWLKSIVIIWMGIGLLTGANATDWNNNSLKNKPDDIQLSGDIVGKIECVQEPREGEMPLTPNGHEMFPSFLIYIAGTSHIATTDMDGNFKLSYVQEGINAVSVGFIFGNVYPVETFADVRVRRGKVVNIGTKEVECNNFFGPGPGLIPN